MAPVSVLEASYRHRQMSPLLTAMATEIPETPEHVTPVSQGRRLLSLLCVIQNEKNCVYEKANVLWDFSANIRVRKLKKADDLVNSQC